MVIRGRNEKWVGDKFYNWCINNEYDGRIFYRLSGIWDSTSHQLTFTSDDEVDGLMMLRIQSSEIYWLEWIDGEPHFQLWFEDASAPYIKADSLKNSEKN